MKTYEDRKLMSQKSGISQQKNDKRNIEEEILQLHGKVKKAIKNLLIQNSKFNPIQDGVAKKAPRYQFLPCNF